MNENFDVSAVATAARLAPPPAAPGGAATPADGEAAPRAGHDAAAGHSVARPPGFAMVDRRAHDEDERSEPRGDRDDREDGDDRYDERPSRLLGAPADHPEATVTPAVGALAHLVTDGPSHGSVAIDRGHAGGPVSGGR